MADITDEMYRKLQKDFVSNYNGTSKLEIMLIVSCAPLSILLRNALSAFLFINSVTPKSLRFLLDFLTLIFPAQLCFTLWSAHIHTVLSIMTFMIVALLLVNQGLTPASRTLQVTWTKSVLNLKLDGRRPFITHFRAYVMVAAVISILAVDFTLFPRRFCKAETFGTGLMDIGVGAFVVSNAIVSPEARNRNKGYRSLTEKIFILMKTVQSCVPMLILGFIRLISVKGTNYQEHVTEYGTHWNFFFTLAAVKLLATLALWVIPVRLCGSLGLVIAAVYEFCLQQRGLKKLILLGTDGMGGRADLLNANREGIFSVLGYSAIYLTGIQLGQFIFIKRLTVRDWIYCLVQLSFISAVLWIVLHLAETHIDLVSRRMANLQFVIWMNCYNIQMICCFLAVDLVWTVYSRVILERGIKHSDGEKSHKTATFCLLDAINRNGLLCFLICNLFTGLVNFSMRTLLASPQTALAVITSYLFIVFSIMSVLHSCNITVKYW